VLFTDKREAEKGRRFIQPPPERPGPFGKPGVAWSVRGVSHQHLKLLKDTPQITLYAGEVKDDGQLLAYPLE
jgi:hypothetical protein